ncbi:Integral membrane protein [Pleurostoma richardsiae]|uniref:Integral membrane protein n=1 Tax=Pleurostoma richardsiae TaxID=41990 RepID=A0AA38RU78_9PEZI|nr:Integral membrane protein [Pleurostoma richardsiae]
MKLLLVAWLLMLPPALGVLVPFENCLSESYRDNDPTPLQWVPLYVDASFGLEEPIHKLKITMWGNVTGSFTNVTLPSSDSSDWSDPNKTDGKILEEPQPDSEHPKLTTLHSKIDVLTYEPYSYDSNFCADSLVNATCPLGPRFSNYTAATRYGLPSVTMSKEFDTSYAFTSFSATFIIKYGDDAVTVIGCTSTTVTPDLGDLAWTVRYLPLLVLLSVGGATVLAAIFSPWGSSDIFHWTSNYGRDGDLLRLVTPGFGDCLQYIQFAVLTGGLTLNYPGFFQPIVSRASWSTLMFNESFVSNAPSWQILRDGVYYTNGQYGLHKLGQLVGMSRAEDIWAGMMVWFMAIIGAVLVATMIGFGTQWVYRAINNIPEEDLRRKNLPFAFGNVVRITFNYFYLPLVALSTFQLVVTGDSPAYTVALSIVTLVILFAFIGFLLRLLTRTKPRAFLFDDLPTVLLYGPLYNTYKDDAATYALVSLLLTSIRGIAIGAVQPSGVAQVTLLAVCEIIQLLTLPAFRPFNSATSMNLYHFIFSGLRLAVVLLMTAFIPSLGVTDGPKGWIGYIILGVHACVLVFGFMLNALQTAVEVLARLGGAGSDDVQGLQRGGLSKIFGARQLQRRMSRREGPSRQSQLSNVAMLTAEDASGSGFIQPGGRLRSESAGSMGVLLNNRGRSSTALDNNSMEVTRQFDGASTFTPGTPGEASTFSFLPSPSAQARHPALPSAATVEGVGDTFYRPPRRRRPTVDAMAAPNAKKRDSWASTEWSNQRNSQPGATVTEPVEAEERQMEAAAPPAPYANPPISVAPRQDYSTREVDFYYGVSRGERLNSGGPNRKMGTGPADPTGPMASAAGWFRTLVGGKKKEKAKGFEVVRSARMPPAMKARGGDFGDETPPEGIPVAMGVLRNGPIESDDEDDKEKKSRAHTKHKSGETELLNEDGSPHDEEMEDIEISRVSDVPPLLPGIDSGGSIHIPSRIQSKSSRHPSQGGDGPSWEEAPPLPDVPRKSSRRKSQVISHSRDTSLNLISTPEHDNTLQVERPGTASRLPFERTDSQKRLSSQSSGAVTEEFSQIDLEGGTPSGQGEPRGGFVQQGNVTHVDPEQQREVDLLGSSAEVVYR